jgi:hypothetical protein
MGASRDNPPLDPGESYREWLDTRTGRELANAGSLRSALFRIILLRHGNPTRAEYDDALAMLQGQLDDAIYYGWVESTPQERWEAMLRVVACDPDDMNHYDSEGTYQDYLDSDYWKTIAAYVKWLRGGRCQMCNSTRSLHAHHRTYEHKGIEHKYLEDLVVVCGKCHSAHHGKNRLDS